MLLRGQGMTDGAINQQCSLDQMFVQVPLGPRETVGVVWERGSGRGGNRSSLSLIVSFHLIQILRVSSVRSST